MPSLICRLAIALARSWRAGSRVRAFLSAASRRAARQGRVPLRSRRRETEHEQRDSFPRLGATNRPPARGRRRIPWACHGRNRHLLARADSLGAHRGEWRDGLGRVRLSARRVCTVIWRCRSVEESLTACTTGRCRHPSPTARRGVSISARTSHLSSRQFGQSSHAFRFDLSVTRARATSEILASPNVAELAAGVPARVWEFVAPSVSADRRLTHVGWSIADDMRIGDHLVLDAGARFDHWRGRAAGAATDINKFTVSPRLVARSNFPGYHAATVWRDRPVSSPAATRVARVRRSGRRNGSAVSVDRSGRRPTVWRRRARSAARPGRLRCAQRLDRSRPSDASHDGVRVWWRVSPPLGAVPGDGHDPARDLTRARHQRRDPARELHRQVHSRPDGRSVWTFRCTTVHPTWPIRIDTS